jgi:hypothetical protein
MDFRSCDIITGIKTEIPLTVLLKHQHKSIADCPEAPYVPKAEIIEKFGLYRNSILYSLLKNKYYKVTALY